MPLVFHTTARGRQPPARDDIVNPSLNQQPKDAYRGGIDRHPAFTLIELLVVVSIISVLIGLLLPSLSRVRERAKTVTCASNAKQLVIGNYNHAGDYKDHYVRAAEDIFDELGSGRSGHWRWHGYRDGPDDPFDPRRSPLAPYLDTNGGIKICPSFEFHPSETTTADFELGTGGYGYNQQYIGGRNDLHGFTTTATHTSARTADLTAPAITVMFGDAGFAQTIGGTGRRVAEYSFIEPPFRQESPGPPSGSRTIPSIHFRHAGGTTNAAWADGHVDQQIMAFSSGTRAKSGIGWFGPESNDWFTVRK